MNLLRRDEVNVGVNPASGEDHPLTRNRLRRHANDEIIGHSRHHVGVARFTDASDATILDTDICLPNASPINNKRVSNNAIQRPFVRHSGRLTHAIPQDLAAAEDTLISIDRGVFLNLGN